MAKATLLLRDLRDEWNSCPSRSCSPRVFSRSLLEFNFVRHGLGGLSLAAGLLPHGWEKNLTPALCRRKSFSCWRASYGKLG